MPTRTISCEACGGSCRSYKSKKCRKCKTSYNAGRKYERQRNANLKFKYGITSEDFEEYWYIQQGKCYICRIAMKMPTRGQGQAFDVVAVDHCHTNNKFRALLCNGCNKGLGHFKDSPTILRKAAEYLEIWK